MALTVLFLFFCEAATPVKQNNKAPVQAAAQSDDDSEEDSDDDEEEEPSKITAVKGIYFSLYIDFLNINHFSPIWFSLCLFFMIILIDLNVFKK